MEVLFNLLAHCYERGSVLITSNLPFSRWEEIFKDPMTTAAAIDRLVHHSVILELNISSYRLEAVEKEASCRLTGRRVRGYPRPQANGRDDADPGRNTDVDNLPSAGGVRQPMGLPAQTVPSTGIQNR